MLLAPPLSVHRDPVVVTHCLLLLSRWRVDWPAGMAGDGAGCHPSLDWAPLNSFPATALHEVSTCSTNV